MCLVCNLPGARKVNKNLSHSANMFCSICRLKKKDISNLDERSWQRQSQEEHLAAAFAWRDAQSAAERRQLEAKNGVCWSELLRLPYWEPTQYVVPNGMHNLLLGIVQHHFRVILGLDEVESFVHGATDEEKKRIRDSMSTGSPKQVGKCPVPTLIYACHKRQIDLSALAYKGRFRKNMLIAALSHM